MATSDLATELMESLTPYPYSDKVTSLDNESAMSSKVMQTIKTAFKDRYEFNSDVFRARNGTPKPTGMLELFGKYSGIEAQEIRKDMIRYVRDNRDVLCETLKDALSYKSISLSAWIAKMSLKKSVCDEIALFVLCKLYSRHAIIYTNRDFWTTVKQNGETGSEIERQCDLVLNHTVKGLVLCKKIGNSSSEEVGKSHSARNKRKTKSIQSLLKENQKKEREKENKVSATVSTAHILPNEGQKSHNTRHSTPLRRRQNVREKRHSCVNKNYSDNLDAHHLDSPPRKKSKRINVAQTLREPSQSRVSAQKMITRGELQ